MQNFKLRLDDKQRLFFRAIDQEIETEVFVKRLFPSSHPNAFFMLFDKAAKEKCLIEALDALPVPERSAIEQVLARLERAIEILRIDEIIEESELRVYKVQTPRGPRNFVTKNDDWPKKTGSGSVQMTDLYGDLYELSDWAQLDEKTRRKLWSLVDVAG